MLLRHIVVPVAVVAFLAFLHVEVTERGRWPMLAIALAVWLLFANSVTLGGMTLWHERRLLEGVPLSPRALVASAALVPAAAFVAQIAVLTIVMTVQSTPDGLPGGRLALPAVIAWGCGTAAGVLAARVCTVRTGAARIVPVLVLATLLLTPVLYPLSALGSAADPWCTINPICTATELARADVADRSVATPDAAPIAAMAIAVLLVAWALLVTARPRPPGDPRGPGLRISVRDPGPPRTRSRVGAVTATFVEALVPHRPPRPPLADPPRLRDVDLVVAPGEVVCVVGTPDAGRTPLLQIAAGLRRPWNGTVTIGGPVASLVDPRSGTHSALDLRDTLILRALADGLPLEVARERAQSILEFTELVDRSAVLAATAPEEVRVRLAFGAMAFLAGRVLVWDDDLLRQFPGFRQRCLALIPELTGQERALLLASGDLGKIGEIATRSIWLAEGGIRMDGPTAAVLDACLAPRVEPATPPAAGDSAACRLVAVELLDDRGRPAEAYLPGDPITVALELDLREAVDAPYLVLSIAAESGPIAGASMFLDGHRPDVLEGRQRIECRFSGPTLAPRHPFTVRFAMYARDGATVLVPKQVVAHIVTGGSAATCGLSDERAAGRVLGAPPVLADYEWRLPDASRSAAERPTA